MMQYQVRQTVRVSERRMTEAGPHFKSSAVYHYIPARDKEDATHLATALDRATDQYWQEGKLAFERSFDVVCVVYSQGIDGSRKVVLSVDDMEMIAREYTNPQSADALAAE